MKYLLDYRLRTLLTGLDRTTSFLRDSCIVVVHECKSIIHEFCTNVLKCRSDIVINRAHPLQKGGPTQSLIAHLPRDDNISEILKNVRLLRGTSPSAGTTLSQ